MQKIKDLKDTNTDEKLILLNLIKPLTLAEIAVKTNVSYTTAHQRIAILEAKGYIQKIRTTRNRLIHKLKGIEA